MAALQGSRRLFYDGRMSEVLRTPRAPARLRIVYQRMDEFFGQYTENISKGGLYIQTLEPFAVGTVFSLVLKVPARTEAIELKAKVQWTNQGENESISRGMGVKFLWETPESRRALERTVEELMQEATNQDHP